MRERCLHPRYASTHFVIGSYRNGLVVQIFSHRDRSWHAGSTYNIDRFGVDFANAGYLLLEDLGDDVLLPVLSEHSVGAWYAMAMGAMTKMAGICSCEARLSGGRR